MGKHESMRMTTEQKREIVEGGSKSMHSRHKHRLSMTSMIAVRRIGLSIIRAASMHWRLIHPRR